MGYSSKYQEAKPALIKLNKLLDLKVNNYNENKINDIKLINYSALNMNGEKLFSPLTCSFNKGELYLIKGENGIGKTTLVESVMGFNLRFNGKILINNQEDMFSDFVYISSNGYISKYYDDKKASGSNGEKKLSQLFLYLKTQKSVYILDEPTNFIDQQNKIKIYEKLKSFISKDKMIIVISHDKEFEKIATKIIEIK